MCIVIDLDVVCLICLQHDKQMHCIFSPDVENPDDIQIAQKISTLSELKLDQNHESLPDKICNNCLIDLKAAWRFHKNCQAAKTIFETIIKGNKTLEECEDLAAKELAEQKIKVPQGLQIKRIQNDNTDEAGVSKKSVNISKGGESLITEKSQAVVKYDVDDDNDNSTLYEELAPNEFVKDFKEDEEEFNAISEEEDVDNGDDDGALIEYYLADDVGQAEQLENLVNVVPAAAADKLEKQKVVQEIPPKLIKGANIDLVITNVKSVESKNSSANIRSRGRPRNVDPQQQFPKSSNQQSRPKDLKQTITKNYPIISEQNIHRQYVSTKTEVREIRTRKRKSLSPDTKPPKICELCGNSYRFQHALNAHMRRHYNDKPFPCECCEKAFVSNVELRRHMRVHTGAKPYACQYCERRFSDFGSRIKHERTHTGERPYVCLTCGKSFAYPHVLSVHLRIHTGEKRFRCDHCSKGFTKKAYLQSHIEQHHNSLNFHVVSDDTTDNSQMIPMRSEAFEECIFTTELINDAANDIPEDEEDEYEEDEEDATNLIQQVLIQPKTEDNDNEDDVHEIVEVHPDEYTIRIR